MDLSDKILPAPVPLETSHSTLFIHLPSPISTDLTKKVESTKSMIELDSSTFSNAEDLSGRVAVSEETKRHTILEVVKKYCPELISKNPETPYFDNPLLHAINNQQTDFFHTLIRSGAELNERDEEGYTPLMHAIRMCDKAMINALIEAQADLSIKDSNGQTALMHALRSSHDLLLLLARNNPSIDLRDDRGHTALMLAVQDLDITAIEILLQAKADSSIANYQGKTPLMWALKHQRGNIVRALLQGGADPNFDNHQRYTPLMLAAKQGDRESAELLLEAGANCDAKNNGGVTALILAAGKGHKDVVNVLINAHSNVNALDINGHSALMSAIVNEHDDIACMLIEAGALVDERSKHGDSPLALALLAMKKMESKPLLSLLMEKGASFPYAEEVLNRQLLGHIWGLKGYSETIALEGTFSKYFLINALHTYLFEFFKSEEFKSFNSGEFESSRVKISDDIQNKILNDLKNSYPLTVDTPAQLLAGIHSENASPCVIMTGSQSHALSLVLYNQLLVVCNRGEGRQHTKDTTTFYSLPASQIDEYIFTNLITLHKKTESFINFIKNMHLPIVPHLGYSQKNQEAGNCAWANSKAVVRVLCQFYTDSTTAEEFYKCFTAFTRQKSLEEYQNNSSCKDAQLINQIDSKKAKKSEAQAAKTPFGKVKKTGNYSTTD